MQLMQKCKILLGKFVATIFFHFQLSTKTHTEANENHFTSNFHFNKELYTLMFEYYVDSCHICFAAKFFCINSKSYFMRFIFYQHAYKFMYLTLENK